MTILSEYQKYKTQQLINQRNKNQRLKDNQFNQLESSSTYNPVVDMSKEMKKVRQNNTTLNNDYVRLTSSSYTVHE